MSELLQQTYNSIPPKCRRCPVLEGIFVVAEMTDEQAVKTSEIILNLPPDDSETGLRKLERINLDNLTGEELTATSALRLLIDAALDECPGSKRGSGSIQKTLQNAARGVSTRTCQNPNLALFRQIKVVDDIVEVKSWIPKFDN